MQPLVSIIVPCYGVEKYLDRCLESLVNQTLRDIEIILVDDKSPDNVPQMCDEWSRRDERIKVIHKIKNEGLGYARNSGLEIATGKYVAFVDSDDFVDKKMYQTLYGKAKAVNADVVFCGFNVYYNQNKCKANSNVDEECLFKGKESIKDLRLDFISPAPYEQGTWKYEMSVWHSIYNLNIIRSNDIIFLSERVCLSEDLPFQIDYLRHANTALFIPDNLYYYCMNNMGSLTHAGYDSSKLTRTMFLYKYLIKGTKSDDVTSYRVNRFLHSYLRAHIYGISLMKISLKQKVSYLKEICDEEEKNLIAFPSSSLPLLSRLFAIMIKHKLYYPMIISAIVVQKIKNYK